jgi:hypothetical protein
VFRKFVYHKGNIARQRKFLIQKGGFLPLLIPSAIDTTARLISFALDQFGKWDGMKFSRKMILIPASGREEPETEKMSELHQEMSAILKNRWLSTKEKVEMYNEVLRRNLIFESRLLRKPQGSQENIYHNFVLSVGNKSMNSSATTNTSFDSDASLSFNISKKEEKRDVEDEDKEAVQKVKTLMRLRLGALREKI